MTLDEYQEKAFLTARIDWANPAANYIPALGVIGELGSVASELKKIIRDGKAYTDGHRNLAEEFGDLMWYLAALATRHGLSLGAVAKGASVTSTADKAATTGAHIFSLLEAVAGLVQVSRSYDLQASPARKRRLVACLATAIATLIASLRQEKLRLSEVLKANLSKGESKFGGSPATASAPCFDDGHEVYERLPRYLEVQVIERDRGEGRVEVLLRCQGLNIGDRLTDNAEIEDGYRYHDVFHFAYAAVLGWSPVIRSLLRCKRKSNSKTDENQDGARATIVEEAIAHTVFQYAESHSLLKNLKHIDHGILLLIKRMVRNLEVESLAMHEWERAIFAGFNAFREIKKNRGGWLTLDAETRSLKYSVNAPVAGTT